MKKSILFIALAAMVFATILFAQNTNTPIEKRWKTVDELAAKQLPESALKEVESILAQAQKEKNSVEVIKAMVYKMRFTLEKNLDEAPALIQDFEAFTEKSTDPAERALLHSMTAELYAQYYQKNQWTINNRTPITGMIPDDMKEWSKNIFFDKISKHLAASMENPSILQQTDALKFVDLIQEGNDSRELQPTLFDFLGNRKIQILDRILLSVVRNSLINAELFDDAAYFAKLPSDSTLKSSIENQIVETYQQLLFFRLKTKPTSALIFIDLQRLIFVKAHNDINNSDSLYLGALTSLEKQYSDEDAVIEVLAEKANYYRRHAEIKNNNKIAYDICVDGIKRFPNYKRINILKNIQLKITQKSINISYLEVLKPATMLKVSVQSSNVNMLQLHVYRVNATAEQYYTFKQKNLNQKVAYSNRTMQETRDIEVKSNSNFGSIKMEVEIKTGDYGIYEFSLHEKNDSTESERALGAFTVTDLAYMNRTTEANIGNLYVLDRLSGQPQKEVSVSIYTNKWAGNGYKIEFSQQLITDKTGLCQYPFSPENSTNIFFFSKGKDRYFSTESYSYFNQQNTQINENARLNLFTDRSLYRPGQTIYFKGIAYYSNKTKQQTVDKGIEYEVTLFDANNQKVSSKKLKTNEFGSFAGEFVLPQGGLNGTFRIQSGNYSETIRVEEYKRPTFEVIIERPKTEVSFGEKVTMTGNVKAYAGNVIGDAKVKYRVVRRPHRYCWWFREPDQEITNGTTSSKADGTFDVSFVPEKSNDEDLSIRGQFYTYTVYADVTDLKGETQKEEQSISVGDKSLFILSEIGNKIDKKQVFNIDVRTETLIGENAHSVIKYSLSRLTESDKYAEEVTENIADEVDEVSDLKVAEEVLTGTFVTDNKTLKLELGKLVSGRYKIQFNTTDSHGKQVIMEKIFILYSPDDKLPPVKSYVWMLTPKTECVVGETAKIQFGTSTQKSMVLYEIMQGNKILESRWIPFSDEIKSFGIPFKESFGAGVTVMFTFMKDEQLFVESIQITRKIAKKKLTPTLSVFRNKLLPGETAEWTIAVPESAENKKVSELMVGMYDASLDALRSQSWQFNPTYQEPVIYSPQWTSRVIRYGSGYASFQIPVASVKEFDFNHLNWFGLNISSGGLQRMISGRIAGISMNSLKSEEDGLKEVVVVGYGTQKKMVMTGAVSVADAKGNNKPYGKDMANVKVDKTEALVQIRTNFNETAFFYPQLRTDSVGNVKFSFTAPESLTRWNVKMLAHTKDLYFGQGEAQVVTQKDLMVQMNLPRFVRRSDKLVLIANVVNLTDKELTASVQFEMIDPETEKPIVLKDAAPKIVTLKANETKAVEWELTEFSPYELVTCKVVARAGNFSDGEQKYLPVLPDKVLITESMPLTIRGNETRTFNFESLIKIGSKVDTKNLSVEFSSNPAWYAVLALPTISTPEDDNALDYFTAYYANSLAAFIANSNPKIAATFDRWKNAGGSREALLSNLEKNKELKNMLLEETPWILAAKDETEQKRQIALLFDLNLQKNQAKQYLDKLISLQLPSGGFSWFKGMSESRYITQEILLNLGRLNRLTGESLVGSQKTVVSSALHYLDFEIARDFENLKKYNKNYDKEMSIDNMQLFYLHLRSEYPTFPIDKSAQEAMKFYNAQSEKYWTNLTLYGKAMMAVVAQRNGKTQIAGEILKSLKENAMKTDELGMYWARNTSGYFWNERPVAVQAAIIEAFAEVSKSSTEVDEMKIWLLKQKQTQRWDSPIATVDAIYALLNQGSDWLANEGSVKIKVGNTLLQPASTEAGTGYFKETIPVADICPEMGKVAVSKLDKGIGWGAMYWQYYQDLDKIQGQNGSLKITKKLFVEKLTSMGKTLLPIEQTELKKGDKVITRLVITTDRNLEFVALKDLRASCFEPVNQLSEYKWKEGVGYYQTTKDASTQFFFGNLPIGTYVFEYELWANNSGEFTSGIASIQCQYAPEFVSHTGGERIIIK